MRSTIVNQRRSKGLRIIGGRWRSRRLLMPASRAARPMPDRIRGAVFNVLGVRYGVPGGLPPLLVADAFAGTGALGLEALSRGAAFCVFFEADARVLATLRQNLIALDAGDRSRVIPGDAWRNVSREHASAAFDLLFLDPPYADTAEGSEQGDLFRWLVDFRSSTNEAHVGSAAPLVILHVERSVHVSLPPELWRIADRRAYGSHAVYFLEPNGEGRDGRWMMVD